MYCFQSLIRYIYMSNQKTLLFVVLIVSTISQVQQINEEFPTNQMPSGPDPKELAAREESIINSINDPNKKFLELEQLNFIVFSGNAEAVQLLTKKLISDTQSSCQENLAFLTELLAKVRSAIEIQKQTAQEIAGFLKQNNEQIKALEQQIQIIIQAKQEVNLDSFNEIYQQTKVQYDECLKNHTKMQEESRKVEEGLKEEIKALQNCPLIESMNEETKKLKATEDQIKKLQEKLEQAKNRKTALIQSIQQKRPKVDEKKQKLQELKDKLQSSQEEYSKKLEQFEKNCETLKKSILQFQALIKQYQQQSEQFNSQIDQARAQIEQMKQAINQDQFSNFTKVIENLEKVKPQMEQQVDAYYYECFGAKVVASQTQNTVKSYLFEGNQFDNYLTSVYQEKVFLGSLTQDEYLLFKIDILSAKWIETFGFPLNVPALDFGRDFFCFELEQRFIGSGEIESIAANRIDLINEDQEKVSIYLGACSRLQCLEELPKIGQNLAYLGTQSTEGGINLLFGTCI